jgi:uncharacterized membrane protein YgcG
MELVRRSSVVLGALTDVTARRIIDENIVPKSSSESDSFEGGGGSYGGGGASGRW